MGVGGTNTESYTIASLASLASLSNLGNLHRRVEGGPVLHKFHMLALFESYTFHLLLLLLYMRKSNL